MKRFAIVLLVGMSFLATILIEPVFSHPPEVRDVVPRDVDGSTHLDITVWHDIETSLHFVDTVEVTDGDNVTSLIIGPQPLELDGTFVVEYVMGPVYGTPTVVVRARCTVTLFVGAVSWTGQIPEIPALILLPLFMIGTLTSLLLLKKHRVV